MKKLLIWQKVTIKRIKGWSDEVLLAETICAAAGDGQDGSFTNRGAWEFRQLKLELIARLPESFRGFDD
jgi:hypothetical protein